MQIIDCAAITGARIWYLSPNQAKENAVMTAKNTGGAERRFATLAVYPMLYNIGEHSRTVKNGGRAYSHDNWGEVCECVSECKVSQHLYKQIELESLRRCYRGHEQECAC